MDKEYKMVIRLEQTEEFERIKEKLQEYAYTEGAKKKAAGLQPMLSETEVLAGQRETTQARWMLQNAGNPPLTSFQGMEEAVAIAEIGGCLTCEQLEQVAASLTAVRRMKDYLMPWKAREIGLPYYEEDLDSMDDIRREITEKIRNGKVDDYASKTLKTLRGAIERLEQKMREKAEAILRANKSYAADQYCTMRNGHICLPIKKEYKNRITGSVIGQSSTGNTVFLEPSQIASYEEERARICLEEENEVRTILYQLTALLADASERSIDNQRVIEKLDFMFAKAKLSLSYAGTEPVFTTERKIVMEGGRHPLMKQSDCVPLSFCLGDETKGVVITGPNTGGKTVAMKTVGMNCLLAQCGLHVSCIRAEICGNSQILCDIGDGQNLSENLSTFSAHITKVLEILKTADRETLVLMDELGSGTDPTEGMGIAIAVLEELKKSGTLFLVTTHYPEVKTYADRTEGVVNARMAFDRETLKPLYRLEMGEAGDSCAFYIAERLGMPGHMLRCASEASYGPDFAKPTAWSDDGWRKKSHEKWKKRKGVTVQKELLEKFRLGDCVMVYPEHKIGIVCRKVNEKGVLRIQLKDRKVWINHKRVKLHVPASELYPENYDFSILFDSVEERKARHTMERKYAPGIEIRYDGVDD